MVSISIPEVLRYLLRLVVRLQRFSKTSFSAFHLILGILTRRNARTRGVAADRDADAETRDSIHRPSPVSKPVGLFVCGSALPGNLHSLTGHDATAAPACQSDGPAVPIHNISFPRAPSTTRSASPSSQHSHISYRSTTTVEELRGRANAITNMIDQELQVKPRSRRASRSPGPSQSRENLVQLSAHSSVGRLSISSRNRQTLSIPHASSAPIHYPSPLTMPPYAMSAAHSPPSARSSEISLSNVRIEEPSPTTESPVSRFADGQGRDHDMLVAGSNHPYNARTSSNVDVAHETNDQREPPRLPALRGLKEMAPPDFPRYARRQRLTKVQNYVIHGGLDTRFPHIPCGSDDDIAPWVPVTHPEGALYFHDPERRIYTDAYMYDVDARDEMEECIRYIYAFIGYCTQLPGKSPISASCELVVELDKPEASSFQVELLWQYYLIDHDKKCLFWLRDIEVSPWLDPDVCSVRSPAQYYYMNQSWYWQHWAYFPTGKREPLGTAHFQRLSGQLDFAFFDGMTSPTSTNSFTLEELKGMNEIVQHAIIQSKDVGVTSELMGVVARIEQQLSHWRFVNFHGQRCARLDSLQSVHSESIEGRRTWFITIFRIVLFDTPMQHLLALEKVVIDETVSVPTWHKHFKTLLAEWDKLNLLGTVILTANVSFLAIPAVLQFPNNSQSDLPGNNVQFYEAPLRSGPAILSFISTVVGLGSIVIGLLLARSNRSQIEPATDAVVASAYLTRQSSRYFHLEPLAVLYSLPFALLVWATGLFLGALLCFAVSGTDTVTRTTVTMSVAIIASFLAWYVFKEYEDSEKMYQWRMALWEKYSEKWELIKNWLPAQLDRAGAPHASAPGLQAEASNDGNFMVHTSENTA